MMITTLEAFFLSFSPFFPVPAPLEHRSLSAGLTSLLPLGAHMDQLMALAEDGALSAEFLPSALWLLRGGAPFDVVGFDLLRVW